jgi:DNA (cytosine-5)-methyltransferase 1
MKVLDLFSGIGGFSIGLEKVGFETVAFCEIERYCQEVLKRHWPDTPIYDDVRTLSAQQLRADGIVRPDIIVGGYPCQPFSYAGVRRGEEDDRHLWPEVYRLIKEIRPTWGIFENVAGHITMGLDEVLSDLEAEGYAARPFVIPACGVDAPHRRDRVWIVAHSNECADRGNARDSARAYQEEWLQQRDKESGDITGIASGTQSADTVGDTKHDGPSSSRNIEDGKGGQDRAKKAVEQSSGTSARASDVGDTQRGGRRRDNGRRSGEKPENGCEAVADTTDSGLQGGAQTQHDGEDGTQSDDEQFAGRGGAHEPGEGWPTLWKPEPNVGRVAYGVSARSHRIRALGNAVVPQIPEAIGRIIKEVERGL